MNIYIQTHDWVMKYEQKFCNIPSSCFYFSKLNLHKVIFEVSFRFRVVLLLSWFCFVESSTEFITFFFKRTINCIWGDIYEDDSNEIWDNKRMSLWLKINILTKKLFICSRSENFSVNTTKTCKFIQQYNFTKWKIIACVQ